MELTFKLVILSLSFVVLRVAATHRVCTILLSDVGAETAYQKLVVKSVRVGKKYLSFKGEDFFTFTSDREKVKDFEKMETASQNEILKMELGRYLTDEFNLLASDKRDAFLKLVKRFVQEGGYFYINRNLGPQNRNGNFSVEKNGSFYIVIPYVDLLRTRYELSENPQEEMMRTLVHELRHYVTHRRQVRARQVRGMDSPESFLDRFSEENADGFVLYIEQMEREAKAAERKFTPGTREKNLAGFLYAEAEAINRKLKAMNLQKEDNLIEKLSSDPGLIRMADNLASAVVEYYAQYLDGRELAWSTRHELGGYLCAKQYIVDHQDSDKNFPFEYTFMHGSITDAFNSVYGRIPEWQKKVLQPILEKRVYLRKREILAHVDKTLSLHPEIKAW